MRKICFVVSDAQTAKAFLKNHFNFLNGTFEVFLVSNKSDIQLSELNIRHQKYIKIEREISLFNDLLAICRLSRFFYNERFDIVCSVTPKAGLLTSLSAFFCLIDNRVHIYTGQVWATKKGFFRFFLKYLDRLVFTLSTAVLVDGNSQRKFLVDNKVINFSKSFVLGEGSLSGVDLTRFYPKESVRYSLRRLYGISESAIVFMFLGRLNRDKGIFLLLEAFNSICRDSSSNVFLMLVGPFEISIESFNELIEYPTKVILVGPTNEPENYLQICDIFCLPSFREGFGNAVIEASACEKPVICSNIYGLRDALKHRVTGLTHECGSVESLIECMRQLRDDEALRILYGKNGRKRVEEHFRSLTLSQEFLNFFSKLM